MQRITVYYISKTHKSGRFNKNDGKTFATRKCVNDVTLILNCVTLANAY